MQVDETGFRVAEPAFPVELGEPGFVIDVKPLPAGFTSNFCSPADELPSDSSPAEIRAHSRIQQERVHASIPGDVDEPDQIGVQVRTDVAEAPAQDRSVVATHIWSRPSVREQRVQLRVGDRRTYSVFASMLIDVSTE